MRIHGAVLICTLAAIVAQASAQQQTVEGAHLFLEKIVEQGATTFEIDDGRGWSQVSADKSYCRYYGYDTASGIKAGEYGCSDFKASSYRVEDYKLTSTMMSSRCATKIKAPVARGKEINVNDGPRNYWVVRIPPRESSFDIDWGKTAEIKQENASVIVRGIKPAIRFNLASESLAVRVAYAMEFLRLDCDATAGTGF